MKNNSIKYILVIMIFVIVMIIIYFLKYDYLSLDRKIQNITWYRYNYNNGLYETLILKDNNIEYFKPTSTNNTNSLDNCTRYTFNKHNNTFKLNCNKSIKVLSYEDNYLSIDFDGKSEKYFKNIEDSLNYEFEVYFQKSIVDFKNEKSQVTEISSINENKLLEVLKEKEYSKIVFIGDRCSTIECTLVLDIMEKWVSTSKNVYYFDTKLLNDKIISYINKYNNNKYSIDYFNNLYPRVIVVNNNKIVDKYEVKCTGFNCTKYYKNEF